MEGTGNTKSIIPVIITVICARTVGDLLSEGIYEELMELRDYPYLDHKEKPSYDSINTSDVMSKATKTIKMKPSARSIEDILATTPHSAFPVIDDTGHYRGMVRRDQLIAALECKIYIEAVENIGIGRASVRSTADSATERGWASHVRRDYTLMNRALHIDDGLYRSFRFSRRAAAPSVDNDISDNNPGTFPPAYGDTTWLEGNVLTSEHDDEIILADDTLPAKTVPHGEGSSRAHLKKVIGNIVISIPPEERLCHVDVGAIMNKCAISVLEDCPLSRTFDIFTSLGLRHLPVLKPDGKVVGMITRCNLNDDYVHEKIKTI